MKITPASLTVNQLFGSGNEQYVIPAYQRRYSWHEKQVGELIDDILAIENNDTHLLGSVVCLAEHHRAGVNELELVDGQQRMTTVNIILECILERLEREGRTQDASEIKNLLTARPPNGKALKKIALDSIDADEFHDLLNQNLQRDFKNQNLVRAFQFVRDRVAEATVQEVVDFSYRIRNQALVIRLDVGHAKDAFKLFETINNRGLKLSPTDIIKNFLLGNAARISPEALELARKRWTELLGHLDATSSDVFFRYYLMASIQTRIYMSEVVSEFKKLFMTQVVEAESLPGRTIYEDADEVEEDAEEGGRATEVKDGARRAADKKTKKIKFKDFLSRLILCAKVYGELQRGDTGDSRINRHLRNLRMIKAVQTYGFLMHLRAGGCDDKKFREILELTESFVLRRHVCRERANETEALFARLCANDPKSPLQSTKDAYRELCPPDNKFQEEFAQAHFSANLIDRARYCLEKIEEDGHGGHDELDVLGADDVHVEHIMPQKIQLKKVKEEFGDWVTYLGNGAESKHSKFVDRIGNLTLLAGSLNIVASNNPFLNKKDGYKKSGIEITKELSWKSNFKFKDIEERSRKLADIAVKLWPSA